MSNRNLLGRIEKLEGSYKAGGFTRGYRVILDEELDEETEAAEIKSQLAMQGINRDLRSDEMLIIRRIVSSKHEGLSA